VPVNTTSEYDLTPLSQCQVPSVQQILDKNAYLPHDQNFCQDIQTLA